ncbi:MAG: HaeIII family restriction endonuclease [Rikenellaceae bacterium]
MDTKNSSIYGKAYEYACVLSALKEVSRHRDVEIIENESLKIAKQCFNEIDTDESNNMLLSAKVGIDAIIEMEPRIIEDGNDILSISLQPDNVATKSGDIRDMLIIRRSIEWEIGVSVKHNHAALKHSRLSSKLDFGKVWLNRPCSQNYFDEIGPIFDMLTFMKRQNKKWSDIKNKENDVYIPILHALKKECLRLNSQQDITNSIIKYLIGCNGKDYYKLIHNNNQTITIMPFNIFGTLNLPSETASPSIVIPQIELPNRIIELEFKEQSNTTLILTMNKGWSISFRIHNASSNVEASLKFDIQLQSKPENIFYLNRRW